MTQMNEVGDADFKNDTIFYLRATSTKNYPEENIPRPKIILFKTNQTKPDIIKITFSFPGVEISPILYVEEKSYPDQKTGTGHMPRVSRKTGTKRPVLIFP